MTMVAFRTLQSVPSYSRVSNVLHLWSTSLISTYRVYRILYMTSRTKPHDFKNAKINIIHDLFEIANSKLKWNAAIQK